MATKFPHQSFARLTGRNKPAERPRDERTHSPPQVPALADRACCCPAKPVVVAVMPTAGHDEQPVDLHLCAHHYRLSRRALAGADAVVFDGAGMPVAEPGPNRLLWTAR